MLQDMVKVIIKQVSEEYPHMANPTVMKAQITSVKKDSKEYTQHCKLKDLTSGEEKDYEVTRNYYRYSIKIIDSGGTSLTKYPPIPNIESRLEFDVGDTVTVAFVGEGTNAVIIGG